jgi:hypothetical protein
MVMKISSLSIVMVLTIACLLSGCGKPQTTVSEKSSQQSQQGPQDKATPQQGTASDRGLDEAGRILTEEIKRRASANSNTQQPPTLGEQVGAAGRPFISYGGGFAVTPPPRFSPVEESIKKSDDGRTEMHTFTSKGPGGSTVAVEYIVISDEVASEPTQHVLERLRNATLEDLTNSTIEKQEFLTVEGHPAISYYVSGSYSGDRLYIYIYIYY